MKRFLILALAAVAACSDTSAPKRSAANLHVALDVSGVQAAVAAPIDSVALVISAPDLTGTATYKLPGASGVVQADLSVPVGAQRRFDVTVYAAGYAVAYGTAYVDVVPGANPPFTMIVRVVQAGGGTSATGEITVTFTALVSGAHITPKTATLALGDTLRFRMLDDSGHVFNDPINFPSSWKYSPASINTPTPGVGLIYWSTPGTLCAQIDASGLLHVTNAPCSFIVVGRIGAVADTASVTVK